METVVFFADMDQIREKFFYDRKVNCGIDCRRHWVCNHFRKGRHKVLWCIFRRNTGIDFNAAVLFVLNKIFVKSSHFFKIWQYLGFYIIFVFRAVTYICAVMLRYPPGGSDPINNNRNNLSGFGYSRRCSGGHIDSTTAKQLLCVFTECCYFGIIVPE